MMTLNIGDQVRWISISKGITKEKVGVIFRVIPAGVHIMSRDHASYMVEVQGATNMAQKKYYWPRVKSLIRVL